MVRPVRQHEDHLHRALTPARTKNQPTGSKTTPQRPARTRQGQRISASQPGEKVTVHRKNGSTQVETIKQAQGLIHQPDGRARPDCFVE